VTLSIYVTEYNYWQTYQPIQCSTVPFRMHQALVTLLSVQCITSHGTEYKIICGVCLCVRARKGFGAEYLEKG